MVNKLLLFPSYAEYKSCIYLTVPPEIDFE